jgi:HSP20 family protein
MMIMAITKWNPFKEMESLLGEFHPLRRLGEGGQWMDTEWSPKVDITETDKEYLIKAELPEVKKEDVKVNVNRGILSLTGERKYEQKDEKQHRIERFYGSFSRSFTLPDNVQPSDVEAEFKDGMLYLHLPKSGERDAGAVNVNIR